MTGMASMMDVDRTRIADFPAVVEVPTRGLRNDPRGGFGSAPSNPGLGPADLPVGVDSFDAAKDLSTAISVEIAPHPLTETLDRPPGCGGVGDPTNPTPRSVEMTSGAVD